MVNFKRLICMGILGAAWLPAPVFAQSYDATPFYHNKETPTWQEYQKYNPYLENGKETQNQQWADQDWYVQDWVAQSANDKALVDGFFRSDILRDQTSEGGVPVLVVGSNFYRLGGFDKRRVITTVDAVYGITEGGKERTIVLRDWKTRHQIGVFTKDGLQLE